MNDDDRDDVDGVDERRLPGDHGVPPFFLERSNIARIRSVTTYPPVTFIAPMITATKPIASSSGVVGDAKRHDRADEDDPVDEVRPATSAGCGAGRGPG